MARTNRLYLRLNDSELALLKQLAAEAGISPANYARQRALGTLRSRSDTAAIRQLNFAGNNLNQIARRMNSGDPLADDLAATLADVRKGVAELGKRDDHDQN